MTDQNEGKSETPRTDAFDMEEGDYKEMRNFARSLEREINELRKELAEAGNDALEEAAQCLPSSWLDPVLSGEKSVMRY